MLKNLQSFVFEFPNFRYHLTMVTGVDQRQISLAQLNSSIPKTSCLVQESRTYRLYKADLLPIYALK